MRVSAIEAAREKKYKLYDLLRGIAKDNIYEEIHFGRPEGDEVW
jgi:antitoxin component of MazEF toxin-antitoxin module